MCRIKLSSNIKEIEVHKSQGFFFSEMASPVSFPYKHNVLGGGQKETEQALQRKFLQTDQFLCQSYIKNHSSGVLSVQIHIMSPAAQNVCVFTGVGK